MLTVWAAGAVRVMIPAARAGLVAVLALVGYQQIQSVRRVPQTGQRYLGTVFPRAQHRAAQVVQTAEVLQHHVGLKLVPRRIACVPRAASLITWAAYLPELAAKLTD